jgi:cytochrome c peroxidase
VISNAALRLDGRSFVARNTSDMREVLACVLLGAFATSCGGGDPATTPPADGRESFESISPPELPSPGPDPVNQYADDARVAEFGQRLFFDTRFSGELLDGDNDGSAAALGFKGEVGKVSCAGCHVPESGFSDTRTIRQQISLAAGWGKRRAPSLLDVGHSPILTWGGRWDSFYGQAIGVFESEVEANSSRLFVAYQVLANHREEYESLFGPLPAFDDTTRFPPLGASEAGCRVLDSLTNACPTPMRGRPGDAAEFDGLSIDDQNAVNKVVVNIGKALGAYQRLLTCGQSRFDAWVQGDDTALSAEEQRGAELFVGKARCVECHSGPFLSDERFHNVGLKAEFVATVFINRDDQGAELGFSELRVDALNSKGSYSDGDDGRLPAETPAGALGAFRTPKLRCVAGRPSFMHTGQFRTLEEVVAFFNRGGDPFGYPGTNELTPLGLTLEERNDLVAFLKSLDGPGAAAHLLSEP